MIKGQLGLEVAIISLDYITIFLSLAEHIITMIDSSEPCL
jgi:hypothetical protein